MNLRVPMVMLLAALWLAGCGDDERQDQAADRMTDAAFVAKFHRGVNELEQHRFVEAARSFEELTKARPDVVAPWINLASAQLNRNVPESHAPCLAAAERAIALDPKAPQPYFLRGVLFKHLGRFDEAEASFREALARAPGDPGTLYFLAGIAAYRDPNEAAKLFEQAIDGETHLASAYYALSQARRGVDPAAVQRLIAEFQAFKDAGTGSLIDIVYTLMGRLGEAVRDLPIRPGPAAPEPRPVALGDTVALPGRALGAVEHGGKLALACQEGSGTDARIVFHQWAESAFARLPFEVKATGNARIAPGDFDQDGIDDLAILDGSGVRLARSDGQAFHEVTGRPLGADKVTGSGLLWSDLDQDADLDLVVWSRDDAAVHVFVNERDGTFERHDPRPSDTKPAIGGTPLPPAPKGLVQVCATDLDGDGDPDLLLGGDSGLRLWRNDRLMRFTDVTTRAGLENVGFVGTFRVADVDRDRAFDILVNTQAAGAAVYRQATSGPFRLTFSKGPATSLGDSPPVAVGDLDCDGRDEVVTVPWDAAPGNRIAIVPIAAFTGVPAQATTIDIPGRHQTVFLADLTCDLALDLVVSTQKDGGSEETVVHRGKKPPQHHALEIKLAGKVFPGTTRANTGGIGARVEVVAGDLVMVREVRSNEGGAGGPLRLHFGLGTNTNADYVRIVWPDDVLQSEGWVPGDQKKTIEEFQRKASSCPILFAWNGERFECVTDFLGVGGLGFFLEPGSYGPPDPTEQVLIPRLLPREGRLELRIHEPFEEITYLDMARLVVVDHPADVTVVPDERFAVNAPAPDGKLLAIGATIAPVLARDGRGHDVLDALLRADRRHARAFPDPRFLGYAEPTTFELDFGEALAARSESDAVYLALDGWVEYPYSHVNLAAWQAGVRLRPLSIDVEVAGRGFVRIQDEACYPAGMPRIMTLPLGKLPAGMTGRLRLSTNQELWIDRLFLFEPSKAALEVRTLQAASAILQAGGYPREYSPDGSQPRLYDYDIRDPSFPWKTIGGAYTRFGDVAEILREPDDRYAIFGGGEEIALAFDAPPPPAAGMRRTYVLDTFGWCKDMDPYTAFPHTVEPLPFRGMSNYPYAPEERFPDGEAHRAWRERYQTRLVSGTRGR